MPSGARQVLFVPVERGVVSPVELVAAVCDTSLSLEQRLRLAGRVRGWLDAVTLSMTTELAQVRRPDAHVADSGCLSGRSTEQVLRRARTVDTVPQLGEALAAGAVGVDHVDVLDRALRRLEGEQRDRLVAEAPALVAEAGRPEDFERAVKAAIAVIETEVDREARLVRQRRAARFRTWVDKSSGMWRCSGEFDPDTGRQLQGLLDAEMRVVFAAGLVGGPDDPIEKNQWLMAQAAANVMLGKGAKGGRPEIVVAVRADGDGRPQIDWGLPVELPRSVFDELFHHPDTVITGVIVRDGVVLFAPGELNLGYTTRLANRAQRRALRAVHATCGAGGCDVRFDQCSIHHIIWWRHGGPTDLWNLIPLCWRHHADVHSGRLTLPRPNAPPGWRPP